MGLRPLLDHRPDWQKAIAGGLKEAGQRPRVWQRAQVLRGVLDKIRADIHPSKGDKKDNARPQLSGTVTIDGQPLAQGTIRFWNREGNREWVCQSPVKDGKFQLPTPTPGKYNVHISSLPLKETAQDDPARTKDNRPPLELIPARYNNTKSTLMVEIKEGNNDLSFELTSR
jgi:hypothetical protein